MAEILLKDLASIKPDADIQVIRQRLDRNPAELQLSRDVILDCLEASVLASRETAEYRVEKQEILL